MTRRHYDSKKLKRYQRRKVVRQSWRYRFWKWQRRNRVLQRLDTLSTHVRYLSLGALAAYFYAVLATGPGSGLLPPPWDSRVCWVGGIGLTIAQVWSIVAPYWKEERAKLARMDRLLSYKKSLRQRELK